MYEKKNETKKTKEITDLNFPEITISLEWHKLNR